MKVLILTTELNSKNGWGRYSLDMTNSLLQSHIDVIVAVNKNGHNESSADVLRILPNSSNYIKNIVTALWYALKLRKYAKECDVIHCFVEQYSFIAYYLSKLTRKKYIITTHGTYGVLPYHLSFPVRYLHHQSFKFAQKIICVSNYTKNVLAKYHLINLLVINNGIMFGKFNHLPAVPFEDRREVILSVGALKYRKGQSVSIKAFAKIADKFPNLEYFIIGDQADTDYVSSLKNIVTDLNIESRVKFLSFIPDDELLALYRKAKLLVLTSINKGVHFEGFGLVYLEANASGLPVVGSKSSGAEDAIKEGETGLLVPQNNVEATAGAMEKILENVEIWKSMSKEAVVWAKEHDWNTVREEYVKIYELR